MQARSTGAPPEAPLSPRRGLRRGPTVVIRRQVRRCLAPVLGLALAAPLAQAWGQELIAAPGPGACRPLPGAAAQPPGVSGGSRTARPHPAARRARGRRHRGPDATLPGLPDPSLPAPAATALPQVPEAVRIERRQRLSLAEALAVAVRNDPDLAATVLGVREQQDLAGSARGAAGRSWA